MTEKIEAKRNYDREMQQEIRRLHSETRKLPKLLLHACCAPCSSACLERLLPDFAITVFYYNPNIDHEEEYQKRVAEERRLIDEYNRRIREASCGFPPACDRQKSGLSEIRVMEGDYHPEDFHALVRGLENEPEGGARCMACFRLRLFETARVAAQGDFSCFTTTLTISPLKDAGLLNAIGREAAEQTGRVTWLPSDFKKRNGYLRSLELSREYGLYRQNYCGCSFSKTEKK